MHDSKCGCGARFYDPLWQAPTMEKLFEQFLHACQNEDPSLTKDDKPALKKRLLRLLADERGPEIVAGRKVNRGDLVLAIARLKFELKKKEKP